MIRRSWLVLGLLAMTCGAMAGAAYQVHTCTPQLANGSVPPIKGVNSPRKFTIETIANCPEHFFQDAVCCWTQRVVLKKWNGSVYLTVSDTTTTYNTDPCNSHPDHIKDYPVSSSGMWRCDLFIKNCAGTDIDAFELDYTFP